MKYSKLFSGSAPFLAMMAFLFVSAMFNTAKASAAINPAKLRTPLEFKQGTAENSNFSSDRKRKKKKKKKHHCEAY